MDFHKTTGVIEIANLKVRLKSRKFYAINWELLRVAFVTGYILFLRIPLNY